MDLSFQEKSAWGLLIGIVVVSIFYFPAAFDVVANTDHAVPLVVSSGVWVVVIVVIETVYHVAIATPAGGAVRDERDRVIDLRAERNAGFVLAVSLFCLVGWIISLNTPQATSQLRPLSIAVYILLCITLAEIVKLASQIWYYRAGA